LTNFSAVFAIEDPEDRAKALSRLIEQNQADGHELSRLRRETLSTLLGMGRTQTELAAMLGITRSRVSAMLASGTRPERIFLGTGRLTVAIGGKAEQGRRDPSSVLSVESFAAYEALRDLAKSFDIEAVAEVVPPPGIVNLTRKDLIVLTSPRLLPFVGQVMGADPNLSFNDDEKGWYINDRTARVDYRAPRTGAAGEDIDYAYVGRLPRPDGGGDFLYLAGIHAQGTLGAAQYVVENIGELYRDLKTRRFSTVISCRAVDGGDRRSVTAVTRVAPLYRHDS
jgi:hypothetical protein